MFVRHDHYRSRLQVRDQHDLGSYFTQDDTNQPSLRASIRVGNLRTPNLLLVTLKLQSNAFDCS